MATLWIREYTIAAAVYGQQTQIAQEPGTDQTPVTFSTAAQSAAFGATTRYVTVCGSVKFHFAIGSNPTATTNNLRIPADTPYSFGVTPGNKVSVVAAV